MGAYPQWIIWCDKCKTMIVTCEQLQYNAEKEAIKAGWIIPEDVGEHFCPACMKGKK